MNKLCLDVRKLSYTYHDGDVKNSIFIDTNFSLEQSTISTIIGRSGLGKTTFLKLISGMEQLQSGEVYINNYSLNDEKNLNWLRRNEIGFVFQYFNLIERLTVFENIELPLAFNKIPSKDRKVRVLKVISDIGLEGKENRVASVLSGGEKQRVAIGRAIVHKPSIIFADEPTGALDEKNEQKIIKLFDKLNEIYGIAFLIVTHNQTVIKHFSNSYTIDDHKVVKI